MKHRLMLLAGAGIVLGALVWTVPGQAATGTELCQIKGSATISPGLTTKAKAGTVSISGSLTLCHGTSLPIKSGTVTGTATGTGSCAESVDTLNATITWSTGATSTVSGKLVSVGPVANFEGKVTSGLFAGSPVGTEAEFQPAGGATKATQCNTSTGLTNVTFTGVTW
ncbi:MAG: hypothetical protein ACJ764_01305 [Solirubrobacteraceae bacterium]